MRLIKCGLKFLITNRKSPRPNIRRIIEGSELTRGRAWQVSNLATRNRRGTPTVQRAPL